MNNLKVNHNLKGKITRSFAGFLLRFLRIKVIVTNDHLISDSDNIIIYSNHTSVIDPFILLYSVKNRNLSFTPKDQLYHFWFFTFILNSINCVKIVRNDVRSTLENVMKGIENVKKGLAMVVFPEGGIIKNKLCNKVDNLLPGSFKMSFQSQATILPLTIKGTDQIKKFGWFRKKNIEVYVHPPLKFSDYSQLNTQQVANDLKTIINSVL